MQRTGCVLLRFIIAATRKDNTVFLLANGRQRDAITNRDTSGRTNPRFVICGNESCGESGTIPGRTKEEASRACRVAVNLAWRPRLSGAIHP